MAVERSLGWAVNRKSELMTGNHTEATAVEKTKAEATKASVNLSLALKSFLERLHRDVLALHAIRQLNLVAIACTLEQLSITPTPSSLPNTQYVSEWINLLWNWNRKMT